MRQLFCSQCGVAITAGSKFCGGCGSPIQVPTKSEPDINQESDSNQTQKTSSEQTELRSKSATGNVSSAQGTRVTAILSNRIAFILLYLLAIAPTYVLPYFGSNSALLNIAGTAAGAGNTPFFWMHLSALFIAVALAWFRGICVGKPWIAIFPFLAALFDMLPGFNLIFLVPTMFHVVAIVMGVRGEPNGSQVSKTQFLGSMAALAILLVLIPVQFINYGTMIDGQHSSVATNPESGVNVIRSEPVKPPASSTAQTWAPPIHNGVYMVQLNALPDASPQELKARVAETGLPAFTYKVGNLTHVRVGPYTSQEAAIADMHKLAENGMYAMVFNTKPDLDKTQDNTPLSTASKISTFEGGWYNGGEYRAHISYLKDGDRYILRIWNNGKKAENGISLSISNGPGQLIRDQDSGVIVSPHPQDTIKITFPKPVQDYYGQFIGKSSDFTFAPIFKRDADSDPSK